MHVYIVHVILSRPLVRFSAKPSEGHFVQIYAQRSNTVQKHIYSQIVLQIFDQMRSVNVLLHNVALSFSCNFFQVTCLLEDLIDVARQEDPLALAQTVRLDNVSRLLFAAVETRPVIPQVSRLGRKHPSLWEEIVLLRKVLDHPH